jgi:hypothetical protein
MEALGNCEKEIAILNQKYLLPELAPKTSGQKQPAQHTSSLVEILMEIPKHLRKFKPSITIPGTPSCSSPGTWVAASVDLNVVRCGDARQTGSKTETSLISRCRSALKERRRPAASG